MTTEQDIASHLARIANALEILVQRGDDTPRLKLEDGPSPRTFTSTSRKAPKPVKVPERRPGTPIEDTYERSRSIQLVNVLLENSSGLFIHETAARMDSSRSAVERLVRHVADHLPFIDRHNRGQQGTLLKISETMVPDANDWLAQAKASLQGRKAFDGAPNASNEAFNKYAPQVLNMLDKGGPSNTKEVETQLQITPGMLRGILRRLEAQGSIEAGIGGRGQPTPIWKKKS